MIYLYPNKDGSGNTAVVYNSDHLTEEQKTRGIAIKKLPNKETPEGHVAILMVDKDNKPYWKYRLIVNESIIIKPKDIPFGDGNLEDYLIASSKAIKDIQEHSDNLTAQLEELNRKLSDETREEEKGG